MKLTTGHKSASITEGNITKALLYFFFPILFGTFFQQLYNTVDAIVVGRFVGKDALAAVGGGAAVFVNLIVGFFTGLSSGATVIISQFYGADDQSKIKKAVHTAISMCFIGGLLMMLLGIIFCRPIMILIKNPPEIMDQSVLYLKIYFIGMIPMFIYNIISGIFRAVGDSKTPLVILIISCFVNILLDLVFVILFRLGIRGVALATVISLTISSVISLITLHHSTGCYRFRFKDITLDAYMLYQILKIGFPAGIQSTLYTVSNLIIQTNINTFGTNDIAAWAAYGKIDVVFWMIINAFGISVTTFAGQNYGAGRIDRVKKGMWITLGLSSATTIIISLIFMAVPAPLLSLFTSDNNVISEGIIMMNFLVPFYLTYISIEILSGTIRGCGISFAPMMITVFGICGIRLAWLFSIVPLHKDIITVIWSYPITWMVTSIAFWIYYLSHKWLTQTTKTSQNRKPIDEV